MGVTPLMWKALENYSKFYNIAIWTCPVDWDPAKKELICNKPSRCLIPWAVAVFNGLVLFSVSISLLLLHIYGYKNLTILHGSVIVLIIVLCIFCNGMEIMSLFGENLVYGCNCALRLYKAMGK
jgi:hypothetical protein